MLLENSERIFIFKIPSVRQESAQIVCCHIVYMNVVMFAPVQYSKTLWYFIKKKKKNINVLILIYAHFLLCCRFLDVGGVCGIKCVNFFWDIFFFLSGKQILHEWRHVTKHDDVWLGYKRKESTRGARRELAFGSACSHFLSVEAKFARNRRCLPSPRLSEGEDAETANFRGCHFFQVRWVPRQPNKRRRSCCAECACCCCLSPRCWQAWPRRRYVSLLGGLALA